MFVAGEDIFFTEYVITAFFIGDKIGSFVNYLYVGCSIPNLQAVFPKPLVWLGAI